MILEKQGKTVEANATIKEAVTLGSMTDLHQYGRQLIAQKRPKDALDIFKYNAEKNPGVFTTNVGLAIGYSANGDYKNALKYAKLAQPMAPDKSNKDSLEKMIQLLNEGKDIN